MKKSIDAKIFLSEKITAINGQFTPCKLPFQARYLYIWGVEEGGWNEGKICNYDILCVSCAQKTKVLTLKTRRLSKKFYSFEH